ncbi:lipid A export permease/ATP-binding protein MsbA [Sphaerotilus hippei]|uniref:Lipid A export permease/ATP-binding protein MsbA n=1 Tax=Sphaerotilus hippei TaxID=744406 RepID=A0A318H685_9BURK|nr:lipid A export permease/ATP-binding protein MsbA [Sphaerotilus hippei]PXW94793.1 lipid A export permease/ATP-binding protein MsbA [Sphaerotilus hippei]
MSFSHLRSRLGRIWPYFSHTRRAFILSTVATVVVAGCEPLVPQLLKYLLDEGFKGGVPLWQVPVVVVGLFFIRGLAGYVAQYCLAWVAYEGTQKLRQTLFTRLMDAHPRLYADHSASMLTNMLAHEVQSGALQLSSSGLSLFRDLLTVVALLGSLIWMNWKLTLFVAVLFPALAYVMRTLSRRLHRLTHEGQRAADNLAYTVEENVQAWRVVRLHGAQAQQTERFFRMSDHMRRLALKSVAAASTMTPLTQILAAIALSAVIVTAMWQSGQEQQSVGSFVAFITTMLMLVSPIKKLSEVAVPITRGLASLDRALDLIDTVPQEQDGPYAPARATGTIALKDVGVRYGEQGAAALDGISLDIPAGQVLALVGPSGAGKTTLINLLPRFIEATSGRVEIDGVALQEWNIEALRRQFALVSQDVVLFNDSVAANVSLGFELDRERVQAALVAANLQDFVASLPEGMDTVIGHNGQRLSGGQRQRLAIARAVYKDAPLLILDEATSALDSESEHLVQGALERLMAGRTSIVIAHRLSTIERADRVVVLDGGRIAEQGTHAELLARGGLFARLHALQFQS